MKVISVSNVKGGVGKTTTAAVLAAGLAEKGFRVLMVDSDPQTNLTMCFMQEPGDDVLSLYHIYAEGRVIDEVKTNIKENLDIVPGDFELCNADMQFVRAGRLKILYRALKEQQPEYDFVVIDTPPNLGILSLNAFMAGDYIIVPMAADSFSLKGVRLLRQTLDDVREETDKPLSVLGLLLTRHNDRTRLSRLLTDSIASAAKMLDTEVFESRIRQAVAVQESQLAKADLMEYAAKAPVTMDCKAFVDEAVERMRKYGGL